MVLEEADESLYWLELIEECQVLPQNVVPPVKKEADELVAIFVSSLNTAKSTGRSTSAAH